MATRLWEKGEGLDKRIHAFTVGDDPVVDRHLVRFDVIGSAAHARMLAATGLITRDDEAAILAGLRKIAETDRAGQFDIPHESEDCHTAIEAQLIADAGDAGRKVHTGRSRNDQVLLAMRLYLRHETAEALKDLSDFCSIALKRGRELLDEPMPGYTHMQPAMPSSIGMWLHAFAENAIRLIREGLSTLDALNANPLGSASGFGVPLPLDRALTTKLLAFDRVQRSVIDAQNSRGRYELKTVRFMSDTGAMVEKIAWDMILYSMREFDFFAIPRSFTTGSSIMPQKHNPDVLELLRAAAAKIRGAEAELVEVCAKLPSNYHRDLQYTKAPTVRAVRDGRELLVIATEVIRSFTINRPALGRAMTDDLYATYDVYRRVRAGSAFREAYQATAAAIAAGNLDVSACRDDLSLILTAAKSELDEADAELASLSSRIEARRRAFEAAETSVLG